MTSGGDHKPPPRIIVDHYDAAGESLDAVSLPDLVAGDESYEVRGFL